MSYGQGFGVLSVVGFVVALQGMRSSAAEPPSARMHEEGTAAGSVHVAPDHGVSGEYGTWVVTYLVGRGGIATRGGIRVQLPDAWHSGARNSAHRLQATDPTDEHYVSVRTDRADVRLETVVESESEKRLVKHRKSSLDGRRERYVFVVRVRVVAGTLREGDRIDVVYGDTRGGSRGYGSASIETAPEPILLALDSAGTNTFRLHTGAAATLEARPGPPLELFVQLPSNAAVGESVEGTISLVDSQRNSVFESLTVDLVVVDGQAVVPVRVLVPYRRGYALFPLTTEKPGTVRIRGAVRGGDLNASSNPLVVTEVAPAYRVYWGDLHSHTHFSWDGVGTGAFEYARYVSALDFYAMTDHTMAHIGDETSGLSHAAWEEYTKLTDAHHVPGRFVTLHAYECSMRGPWGHHNVYFRGAPGHLAYPAGTLPELWSQLAAGDALTIPHHTGKMPAGIFFTPQDPERRRNFEIYSGHGLSEVYDPDHPLAFESSVFTSDSHSLKEATFAQDVWQQGLRLSTIASSDDHRSQPGQPHYGLVAIRAPELTRNAVFQALYDRRTYGTTGAKILLDFTVGGAPMGSTLRLAGAPHAEVGVVGTANLEWVELLRHQPPTAGFQVVKRWQPRGMEFVGDFVDLEGLPGAIYYVRVRQTNLIRGLPVMAWSSPVWTRK
jgi:hypothetical protein